MKKLLFSIVCATMLALLLSSCKGREIPARISCYSYTTDFPSNEASFHLFFDGKDLGPIPSLNFDIKQLTLVDSAFKSRTLHFDFISGDQSHFLQLKDATGNVLSTSSIFADYHKNSFGTRNTDRAFPADGALSMVRFDGKDDIAIMISKP